MENQYSECKNSHAENVIKQTVFRWKSGQNRKLGFKIIEKALAREGFRDALLQSEKTL